MGSSKKAIGGPVLQCVCIQKFQLPVMIVIASSSRKIYMFPLKVRGEINREDTRVMGVILQ